MKNLYLMCVAAALVASGASASAGIIPENLGDLLNLGGGIHANIIGGVEVQPNDPVAASTVLLVGQEGKGQFICSGSILTNDIVLTAGHCLGTSGKAKIQVVFRLNIADKTGPVIPVSLQTRPKDFATLSQTQEQDWDDLALVKLSQPIPAGYAPAHILSDANALQAGTPILLAGYGIDEPIDNPNAGMQGAGVLREVDQRVINPHYGQTEVLVDLHGKGACHGDSGGPAFVNMGGQLQLFGVTSRLTNDDAQGQTLSCSVDMVYTNILMRAAWLNMAISKLGG